ncbi:MAG: hypothetical protein PVI43_01560 [Candidatus Bathyarchaeota archaeon]
MKGYNKVIILKSKYKESLLYGKPCKTIAGHLKYDGMIQLLVDEIPHNEMVFRWYGKFLYAEKYGYVRVYHHKPGTKDGFAGRSITININGNKTTFNGDLWDPTGFSKMESVPEYRAVCITEDLAAYNRGYTFYAGYVTKELYEKIHDHLNTKNKAIPE